MTTLSTYLTIANNLTKYQSIAAAAPSVSLQTKYYQANIGKARSIDEFMNNPRLFNYAMTALGLGDKIFAKGLIKKVLQQGVTDPKALANTLTDPRIKAFAKAFDFATYGTGTTSRSQVQTDIVNRYIEQSLETSQGQLNPGVQLALYFRDHAPNVTNMFAILADRKLLTVVQTALGISPLTSAQNIDAQARLLSSKLKISDFQDPKKLQAFIARFSAMYDANNGADGTVAPATATSGALFAPVTFGISTDLLMSLQNLKIGGL
ncbi:MAG: DUF1217 domain-containing protein [Methylocystis sp.]|nr:DUF1217 domain-containing protein [Methylocystis sp.]